MTYIGLLGRAAAALPEDELESPGCCNDAWGLGAAELPEDELESPGCCNDAWGRGAAVLPEDELESPGCCDDMAQMASSGWLYEKPQQCAKKV
jgi:hypothetical protein